MTLTPLQKDFTIPPRIVYEACVYDPDPDDVPDEEKPQQEDDEDEDDYNERLEQWEDSIRELVLPEPDEFKPRFAPESALDMRKEFGQRGLQVIVKLANIYLTREKPIYNGGTWHVEGQMVRLQFLTPSHLEADACAHRMSIFVLRQFITIPLQISQRAVSHSGNYQTTWPMFRMRKITTTGSRLYLDARTMTRRFSILAT